jgi:arginine repressor
MARMAVASNASKSDAVRHYMASHPGATAKEIAASLKRDGITISESLVAKVKARDSRTAGRSKSSRSRAPTNGAAGTTAGGASKAERIRQAAQNMDKPVRPRDVIAALAGDGVSVSSAQVSGVLRSMGMRRRGRGRRAAAAAGSPRVTTRSTSEKLSLDNLLAAKRLVNQLGGIEAAKQAVDALARLS